MASCDTGAKSWQCCQPKPVSSGPLDGTMLFTINEYTKEAFEIMNTLRHNYHLCDVTLHADSEKLYAHKVVLAAASPYFKAMFTNGMKECEMFDVPLHDISMCTLAALIDFAYTSEIRVSEMNVCPLLSAATIFQMKHVVDACSTFLEQQLDPANCIGIADFAQEHGCWDLCTKAREFIFKNFSEVSQNDEFMQLSPAQLIQVIKRDELNVRCESEVYAAVIRWVRHDEERRRPRLEHLLCAVRCHFLTPVFLQEQLQHCDLLQKNPQCKEYLARICQDLQMHKKCTERRRLPSAPPVLYCIGGYLRHSLCNVDCYNPRSKEWIELASLPMPRSGLGVGVVHGLLYAVGGRNNCPQGGNVDCKDVDMYDPFINMWSKCSDMLMARNRVGIGAIDGMLYAVGGSSGSTHHNSVERYDPEADRWQVVAAMATRRIGVGVAVVNRLLYAVGGYDGINRLRSTECYHPEWDEWRFVAPMSVTRSGAGLTVIDQYIYAVGGYDSEHQLSTVERYDTETNVWEFISPMLRPRSALSVAVINNKLYALGGYDGSEFLQSMEVYDPDKNEWTDETPMRCGRSGHGVGISWEPCLKFEDCSRN